MKFKKLILVAVVLFVFSFSFFDQVLAAGTKNNGEACGETEAICKTTCVSGKSRLTDLVSDGTSAEGVTLVCDGTVTAAHNCACGLKVALNIVDIKSILTAESNSACMSACRSNDSELYTFPNVSSLKIGKGMPGTFQYSYNCACLEGSVIPLYYPTKDLKQVTGGKAQCNNACQAISAKYYAFDEAGKLSGLKFAVTAPVTASAATATTGTAGQPADNKIPGTTEPGGIVQCGRPGQNMCTLCNMIEGMRIIIDYLMKIAVGVALLAMAIGGVMYIVSAGSSGLADMGKKAITNAAIGFVIIFAAYLIVNTVFLYLGTKPGLGFGVVEWGKFECAANPNR